MRQQRRITLTLTILTFFILLIGYGGDYLVRAASSNLPPFVKQHLDLLFLVGMTIVIVLGAIFSVWSERIREQRRSPETSITLNVGIVVSVVVVIVVAVIVTAVLFMSLTPIVFGRQSDINARDTQGIWQFFHDNGSGISALVAVVSAPVIFITLVIGVVQALRIEKQLRLASITSSSLHFRELNELVVTHPELEDIFGKEDRTRRAGGIFFSTFETRYLFYKESFIDEDMWASDIASMLDAFNRYPFLAGVWEKNRLLYYRPFRYFIDNEILTKLHMQLQPSQTDADAPGA
jgi:uncharacterized membrane protein YidH (DUF202 family)